MLAGCLSCTQETLAGPSILRAGGAEKATRSVLLLPKCSERYFTAASPPAKVEGGVISGQGSGAGQILLSLPRRAKRSCHSSALPWLK